MVWISSIPEYNMLITMLGCLCAVVQVATGAFAFHYKKKKFMLKSNNILYRSHTTFGAMATVFYFLGLYAGLSLCNGLLYSVLGYVDENNLNIKSGFIHVPLHKTEENPDAMELQTMVNATRIIINYCLEYDF